MPQLDPIAIAATELVQWEARPDIPGNVWIADVAGVCRIGVMMKVVKDRRTWIGMIGDQVYDQDWRTPLTAMGALGRIVVSMIRDGVFDAPASAAPVLSA